MLAENSFADILVLGRQCPFDSPPIISGCYFLPGGCTESWFALEPVYKGRDDPRADELCGDREHWLVESDRAVPAQPSQGRAGHVPVVSALGRRDRDMVNDTPIAAGLCLGTGTAGAGLG